MSAWHSRDMDFVARTAKSRQKLAEYLVTTATERGFSFWQDDTFRKLVDFDALPKTEQDRIFNELVVTALGLLVLHLDWALEKVELTETKEWFLDLQDRALVYYVEWLKETGIPQEYVVTWQQLIDLRLKEYRKDYQTALKESELWEEFRGGDTPLRPHWARIETLVIDGLLHVRRGKSPPDDTLRLPFRRWLIPIDAEIAKSLRK